MAYNPSLHTASNKAYAVSGIPDSARLYKYDDVNFIYRSFINLQEVYDEFIGDQRKGRFTVIVEQGGVSTEWWWREESNLTDGGLVQKELADTSNFVTKITGKSLSTEDYTTAEKAKLAGLDSNKFQGQYSSLNLLNANLAAQGLGNYAYVDGGIGQSVSTYVWDSSDGLWQIQQGSTTAETAASIKAKYESNPDTNALTDSLKASFIAKQNAIASSNDISEGSTNKYFTLARVLSSVLTGIGFSTNTAITATDTVLGAFGKLQAQITNLFKIPTGGTAGQVLVKVDSADGNTTWITPSGGGGSQDLQSVTEQGNTTTEPIFIDVISETPKKIVFLGDSIISGGGSIYNADVQHRYTTKVTNALGYIEDNRGVGGSVTTAAVVPNKTSDMAFLFVAYGTNERLSSIPSATFQANLISLINDALSKGWSASDIILQSTPGFQASQTDTVRREYNTAIFNAAISKGVKYVDVYDTLLTGLPYGELILMTSDQIHPNNTFGSIALYCEVVKAFPNTFNITDEKFVVDGKTIIEAIQLKNFLMNIDGGEYLLSIDASGNIKPSLGLKDGINALGDINIKKGLKQVGATATTSIVDGDNLEKINTKRFSTYDSNNYAYLQILNSAGESSIRNFLGSGSIKFYVSGGTTGNQTLGLEVMSSGKPNFPNGYYMEYGSARFWEQALSPGAANGTKMWLFNTLGDMVIQSTYATATYNFIMAIGQVMKMFASGNSHFQTGGTYADIPSAQVAINSNSKGFLKPCMTTTQRDAIASPAEGLEVYNLTTHKMNFYNGTSWEQITSA